MDKFYKILEYKVFTVGDFYFSLERLLESIIIFLIAKLIIWMINSVMLSKFLAKREVDSGRRYAINALVGYIVYTLTILWILQVFGLKYSVLWGGAAALLVGVGLGLQQTFMDLLSGIILLMEGTVAVDDIVKVDGMIGRVKSIGLRTSDVETRDGVSILIPNSKLVMENATNWSHKNAPLRFEVNVGVAYGADVKLVTELLKQAAREHPSVRKKPAPDVMFKDFGSSSLDFTLYFFSKNFMKIEYVKSDLRYRITELFRENNIEIPFPQRDLWIRGGLGDFSKK